MDANLRRFNSEVPILAQWDDHEVRNNWFPTQRLDDDNRYTVKSIHLLAARAKRAFLDYLPLRFDAGDPERVVLCIITIRRRRSSQISIHSGNSSPGR